MRMKASVQGREAVLRRLRALVPDAEAELAREQLEGAVEIANRIKPRTPGPVTGDYQASIVGARLDSRPGSRRVGGKVKVTGTGRKLQATKDPNATGIFADYIWRFLEFGTRHMSAKPHIFPTFRAYRKKMRRRMANAVNKAVRKARRG